MISENIVIISIAVLCFLLSFGGFYVLNVINDELSARKNTPFIIIFPIFAIASLALFSWMPQTEDFIYPLFFPELLSVLIGIGLVYFSSWLPRQKKLQYFIIFAAAVAVASFMPQDFTFYPGFPFWLNQIIIILCLFIFSSLYQYLNGLDGILANQSGIISLGIFALSILGGTPLLLGYFGLSLAAILAAFLIFNWYPAKLSLIPAGSNALGFLLAWLLLRCTYEGAGPCIIIFIMFYVVEMIVATAKWMTLREAFRDFIANTTYYQANLSGYPPSMVANNVLRLQIVLLILGCFELYAPNAYSIPAFSFIITGWYLSRLKNWRTPEKTIRELNQDLMSDIKSNLSDFKDKINKDQEK